MGTAKTMLMLKDMASIEVEKENQKKYWYYVDCSSTITSFQQYRITDFFILLEKIRMNAIHLMKTMLMLKDMAVHY